MREILATVFEFIGFMIFGVSMILLLIAMGVSPFRPGRSTRRPPGNRTRNRR